MTSLAQGTVLMIAESHRVVSKQERWEVELQHHFADVQGHAPCHRPKGVFGLPDEEGRPQTSVPTTG
jgi:hypothetical protein